MSAEYSIIDAELWKAGKESGIASEHYVQAVVMPFYKAFAPPVARALWDRFEFIFTPRHGSWLNMAEIELNVLIKQCLKRRIKTIDTMRSEVSAWEESRNTANATINWQFSTEKARIKLKRLYPTYDV